MRLKLTTVFLAFSLLVVSQTNAQSVIEEVQTTTEEATIKVDTKIADTYLIELAGPDNYYSKQRIDKVSDIVFTTKKEDGQPFMDGSYQVQVTPIYTLTEEQREILNTLRLANDQAGIAAFRAENKLPELVTVGNISFSIRNGKFIPSGKSEKAVKMPTTSSKWETDHPVAFASLNYSNYSMPDRAKDNSMNGMEDDQVFLDDVIVDGSLCVGQDCVNGESFGFDTERLKENNLRLHFDDTSNSASFPSNDWRITINDSSNGGASYFAVEDATAGRVPFRIIAGAPANSLYVNQAGNVGIGTASPVVELHVTDGDSPTMRLEQNGSSGFGAQTWDIAGNETNFFIRDVTNGSLLPFRIKPRAPKNSLYIDAEGDIGLGTENPGTNALQVESGDVYVKAGNLGVNTVPTVALDVLGNLKVTGTSTFNGGFQGILAGTSTFFSETFASLFVMNATDNAIGLNVSSPTHLLELGTDDAVKPGTNTWTIGSDRRLKTNIKDFTDGLETILQIRPVRYNYNGKLGMPTDKEFIGVIAQEVQEVAPYTIGKLDDGPEGETDYLSYNGSAMTYVLINAVQEQQSMIEEQKEEIETLKAQLAEMAELKQSLASLTELVEEKLATAKVEADEETVTGEDK